MSEETAGLERVDKQKFCYVSWFGGFYGYCRGCGRVMFWNLRWRTYAAGRGVLAFCRCEECGETAELAEGDPVEGFERYWQLYGRVDR